MSMHWCKKDVTPILMHWSYIFLALTHRCNASAIIWAHPSEFWVPGVASIWWYYNDCCLWPVSFTSHLIHLSIGSNTECNKNKVKLTNKLPNGDILPLIWYYWRQSSKLTYKRNYDILDPYNNKLLIETHIYCKVLITDTPYLSHGGKLWDTSL